MNKLILTGLTLLLVACTASMDPVDSSQRVDIEEGEVLQLDARPVLNTIDGIQFSMYGYNGQIPGPTLRVKQGTTMKVNFTNHLSEPTTVHWHGLRHNYKDDGVPYVSQDPVLPGESHLYTLRFPDAGVFWYHPHIREDRQQNLGLYGSILVESEDHDNMHEEFLMLGDLLVENNKNVLYGESRANFALMGRFGNLLLVNGKSTYSLHITEGESVRFYITDVSNARPYNFSIDNTMLKIVGGDIGNYEQEFYATSIVLGPAERIIAEVTFNQPGEYHLRNTNLWQSYDLGTIVVSPSGKTTEQELASHQDVIADISNYTQYFNKQPDEVMHLTIAMHHMMGGMHSTTSIEWEDTMQHMNSMMSASNVRWIIKDEKTGLENEKLTYRFNVGDVKKIRIINDETSAHPMQHLIHLHGQRFLVLEQDGVKNENFVWKDTVMVPTGSYVDILLDASNPGEWMLHCHIAEHLEAGMMSSFIVGDSTAELSQHS